MSSTDVFTTTLDVVASTASSGTLDQHSVLWALILGIVLAFLLGAGMGANDVSNAFGTSVGSRALSITQAYILASIFETLGAVLVGWSVTDTMRKGVVDTTMFEDHPKEFLLGQVAVLGGCAAWLLIATVLHMPVSTSHSLVGSTLGFSLVLRGFHGIRWRKIVEIVASWFISPLLSGIISVILYMIVDFAVLRRNRPLSCGFRVLPIFYFVCIAFNVMMVTWDGSKLLYFNKIPWWGALLISLAVGFLAELIVKFFVNPRIKRKIERENLESSRHMLTESSSGDTTEKGEQADKGHEAKEIEKQLLFKDVHGPKTFVKWFFPAKNREEDDKTIHLFSTIQVFTACFAGFAHGANDVSNSIAPLAALVATYKDKSTEQNDEVPIYVLFYGVLSICTGLWLLGHRVIRTVGTNMSNVNPASGFTIEFGAALTALLASKVGLPISTTHCLVGSVVAVGTVKSGEGVQWKLFGGIATSWVVTLPVAGFISAAIMLLLKWIAL